MKFYYEIGYSSHEDSAKFIFYHSKDFSTEEYQELVEDILCDVMLEELKSDEALLEKYPEMVLSDIHVGYDQLLNSSYLENNFVKRGFVKLEANKSIGYFGWNSITVIQGTKKLEDEGKVRWGNDPVDESLRKKLIETLIETGRLEK